MSSRPRSALACGVRQALSVTLITGCGWSTVAADPSAAPAGTSENDTGAAATSMPPVSPGSSADAAVLMDVATDAATDAGSSAEDALPDAPAPDAPPDVAGDV